MTACCCLFAPRPDNNPARRSHSSSVRMLAAGSTKGRDAVGGRARRRPCSHAGAFLRLQCRSRREPAQEGGGCMTQRMYAQTTADERTGGRALPTRCAHSPAASAGSWGCLCRCRAVAPRVSLAFTVGFDSPCSMLVVVMPTNAQRVHQSCAACTELSDRRYQ